MSLTTRNTHESKCGLEDIKAECAAIFKKLTGFGDTKEGHALTDQELLQRPFKALNVDSLSIMEYVMALEDRFDVVLEEPAVQQCNSIGDLADLVHRQRRG